jgi:hypothetical protein
MKAFITYSLLHITCICFSQSNKEQSFQTTVNAIVNAFSKQDSAGVAEYINKDVGVYQLFRVGAFADFRHFDAVSFSDASYPQMLFQNSKNVKTLPIEYSTLPTFDCTQKTWSKNGLFVDTTKTDHLLSQICKNRNHYKVTTISAQEIQFFYDLETKSRRIVLSDDNNVELVFYLSSINDKWYLTLVDNVSSDCRP